MAAGDIGRTVTALANVTRMHSVADGGGRAFGEVDLGASSGAVGTIFHLIIPINASATGGTYDLYLVESHNGTEWTDDIDPTDDTGDVSGKISDAKFLKSADTTYNAINRTDAEFYVSVSNFRTSRYIGLVWVNNSGQTSPATGADGDSEALKVS